MNKIVLLINLVFVVIIGYFLYFFFISDYYTIRNVQVEGIKYVSTSDFIDEVQKHVDSRKFLWMDTKNSLLFSKKGLRNKIGEQYLFAELDIQKQYPDTIFIKVSERNVIYRIIGLSHEYLIDDTGIVVKRITNYTKRPALLRITEEEETEEEQNTVEAFREDDRFVNLFFNTDVSIGVAHQLMSNEQITFLNDLTKEVENEVFATKSIAFDHAFPQHITVSTADGWEVLFNTNNSLESQIERLKLVLEQEVGERVNRLEYVDMRLGNNIYYKLR